MKRLALCVILVLILATSAFSGSFRGTITGPNGTRTYGDSSHRVANINTVAFLDQLSCAEVCRMMVSQYPSDHHSMVSFMQRLARDKKVFKVEIDTKVDVLSDLGYAFKGRLKGSEIDFWFIADHFFFDK